MITEPRDRFERINNLIVDLQRADKFKEWQIEVDNNFAKINAKALRKAKVLDPNGNERQWFEYEGKKFQHTEPIQLKKNSWAIVYGQREYNNANDLFTNLQKAAGIFGVTVEEPQWVEVPDSRSAKSYCDAIKSDIDPKNCQIVCVVLHNTDLKKGIKAFLDQGNVVS